MLYNNKIPSNFDLQQKVNQIYKMVLEMLQNTNLLGDWMNKKTLKRVFDYSDSQIREMEKNQKLIVSKVGRRKFYSVKSALEIIEAGIIDKAS